MVPQAFRGVCARPSSLAPLGPASPSAGSCDGRGWRPVPCSATWGGWRPSRDLSPGLGRSHGSMGRCFGWGTGGGAFPTGENGPRARAGLGPDTKKTPSCILSSTGRRPDYLARCARLGDPGGRLFGGRGLRGELAFRSRRVRGAARIRTGDKGFAVLCLTTWPRRRCGGDWETILP